MRQTQHKFHPQKAIKTKPTNSPFLTSNVRAMLEIFFKNRHTYRYVLAFSHVFILTQGYICPTNYS